MIRKLIYLLILALWPLLNLKAQVNLVPNPSFEDEKNCIDSGTVSSIYYWNNPTSGTPDIHAVDYCNEYPFSIYFSLPDNPIFGYQQPRTGLKCAGIGVLSDNDITREYLQVELLDTLKAGNNYCVEFYVSLANKRSKIAIKDLSLHFNYNYIYTDTADNGNYPIIFYDQRNITSTSFLTDTLDWMKISGVYHANGGENYIVIGNFKSKFETNDTLLYSNVNTPNTYYYIDDVSVYECDSLIGIKEEPMAPIQIYPNPANGMVTIQTMQAATIKLYNATGQLVLQSTQPQVDCSPLPNGLYVVQVQQGNTISYKRLVIQH